MLRPLPADIVIREAVHGDAEAARAMALATWRGYAAYASPWYNQLDGYGKIIAESTPHWPLDFTRLGGDVKIFLVVKQPENSIVAVTQGAIIKDEAGKKLGKYDQSFCLADYRGYGISTHLIERRTQWFIEQNCQAAMVVISRFNKSFWLNHWHKLGAVISGFELTPVKLGPRQQPVLMIDKERAVSQRIVFRIEDLQAFLTALKSPAAVRSELSRGEMQEIQGETADRLWKRMAYSLGHRSMPGR
ncbi:MAG: hypothetical protein AB7G80_00210 [Dongiaceae bacterium]